MKQWRHRQIREQCIPFLWASDARKDSGDKWWMFSQAVDDFNNNRRERVLAGFLKTMDETMSAYRPQTHGGASMSFQAVQVAHSLVRNRETEDCRISRDGGNTFQKVARSARGRCQICSAKTSWFCPVCPAKGKAGKAWYCEAGKGTCHELHLERVCKT